MEWIVLLIIIIFIAAIVTKSGSKGVNPKNENNENNDFSMKMSVSTAGYHDMTERKPDNFKWIPPGVPVNIAGYEISSGMIYCGKHMRSVSSEYLIEPGFINADLPVARTTPDREGENMGYWPSYSQITPSSRAAYLEWLAGGRVDRNINIGYVFLFFYGLERRLLNDTKKSMVAKDEIQKIIDELKRLRDLYASENSSFNHYVNSLLELIELQNVQSKFYELDPPSIKYTYEMSPVIKLALGQLAQESKPLPANWMYAYTLHHPEIYLRTPAKRCQEEFKNLFRIRYNRKYNEGIVVKPNKTGIDINYHCASPGLGEISIKNAGNIPDVSILKSLLNNITPIIDECQDDLDKYSRWLGQHPEEEESLTAFSLLPGDLANSMKNKELENLKDWISNRMTNLDSVILNNKDILEKWPAKTPGKMSKAEVISFIDILEKIGFGIEPDLRFDNIAIKESGISVLFKLKEIPPAIPSPGYSGSALLLHLAAAVAKADGNIAESERSHLLDFIENSTQLNSSEKWRMKTLLIWLLNSDTASNELKKRLESIDQNQKKHIANYLISVAGADGYIAPEEIKMITKIYKILGLDEKEVFSNIHLFQVDKKEALDEPLTVRPADTGETGYGIPKPPERQGFKLDIKKIKDKMKETAEVSALLSDVFEDDVKETPEIAEKEIEESVHGLDSNHSAILLAFQKQIVWPRSEFEKLAVKYNLLPDGAIDVLNEKSLEICNEILCEGETTIEINQDVLEELLK
ncbi:MAG TPA: TerB N-terminal domain-containing protein [Candidatus Deferrimicrobium sp.]|nr:TerB N-terminal domain-containing protein [Candidatus Kapabacteria bacterium]HLP60965.1 TerB N-terminal domain-containing protein [Candidatus Deferrimicrobium sp.]